MKTILSILILLAAFNCNAQRLDIKTLNDIQYLIKQDTSLTGTITITKTPLAELAKELESQINSVNGRLLTVQFEIDEKQKEKKELNLQLNQLVALKIKLGL